MFAVRSITMKRLFASKYENYLFQSMKPHFPMKAASTATATVFCKNTKLSCRLKSSRLDFLIPFKDDLSE